MMKLFRSAGVRYTLFFLIVCLFFLVVRFPYGELQSWALSYLGRRAGVEISVTGSSFVFPFGIKARGVTVRSVTAGRSFLIPAIEEVTLKPRLITLFSDGKRVFFRLRKGGFLGGVLVLRNDGIDIELESGGVDLTGLRFGDEIGVVSGVADFKGEIVLQDDILGGDGEMHIKTKDLVITGVSPLLSSLPVRSMVVEMVKRGGDIRLNPVTADVGGVELKGRGSIRLERDLMSSRIDFSFAAGTAGGKDGVFRGLIPILKGSAGGETFEMRLTGTLREPRLAVDGRRIL